MSERGRRNANARTASGKKVKCELPKCDDRWSDMFAERAAATDSTRGRSTVEAIKLTKLTDEDDIESYLTTFERIMAANEVSREYWSFQLAPHLTGKAQQAYAALPLEEAKVYDTVKEAILRRYDINEETYRQDFGSCDRRRVSLHRN